MVYITLLVLLGLAGLTYWKYRNWYNPLFFLCIEWFFIVIFAEFGGLGYYRASVKSLLIVTIGIASFVGGGFAIEKYYSKRKVVKHAAPKRIAGYLKELHYNQWILWGTLSIAVVYCAWKGIQLGVDVIGESKGFGQIRVSWLTGGAFSGAKEEFLYNNIILPSVYINMLMVAVDFTLSRLNKLQTGLTLLCIMLIVFFSGARMILMDFVVAVALAFFINRKYLNLSNFKRNLIVSGVALVAIALILNKICIDRQSKNLIQVAMGNFSLALPLLSKVVDMADAAGDVTFGHLFVRGIVELILSVPAALNIDLWPAAYQTLSKYTNDFFYIGETVRANAYVTPFFYFYLDARWLGVVLLSGIFGAFSQKLYLDVKVECRSENVMQYRRIKYIVGMLAVLRTFYNYSYSRVTFVMIFVLLLLLLREDWLRIVWNRCGNKIRMVKSRVKKDKDL